MSLWAVRVGIFLPHHFVKKKKKDIYIPFSAKDQAQFAKRNGTSDVIEHYMKATGAKSN